MSEEENLVDLEDRIIELLGEFNVDILCWDSDSATVTLKIQEFFWLLDQLEKSQDDISRLLREREEVKEIKRCTPILKSSSRQS